MATDPFTDDEGFPVFATDTEPPDPGTELALQEDLAAGVDTAEAQDATPAPLGRSYAFDFAARRLVPGAAGGPLMTFGLDTLAVHIEKTLRQRQGENPACDKNVGVTILPEDLLDGGPFDAGAVAEYEASAVRGLLTDARIVDVAEFAVVYDEDAQATLVSFRAVPEGDDLDDLELTINLPLGAAQ